MAISICIQLINSFFNFLDAHAFDNMSDQLKSDPQYHELAKTPSQQKKEMQEAIIATMWWIKKMETFKKKQNFKIFPGFTE